MKISNSYHTTYYSSNAPDQASPGKGLSAARIHNDTLSDTGHGPENAKPDTGGKMNPFSSTEVYKYPLDSSQHFKELMGSRAVLNKPYDRYKLEIENNRGNTDPYENKKVTLNLSAHYREILTPEEYETFEALKEKAGQDLSSFMRASYWAYAKSDDSAQPLNEFLTFASELSDREFDNYLSTYKKHRDQGDDITRIASKLQGSDRELYLEQGAKGDQSFTALNSQIGQLMNAGRSSEDVSLFLSAALKSGYRMDEFLDAADEIAPGQKLSLASLVANDLSSRELDAFLDVASFVSANRLQEVVGKAMEMKSGDRINFFKAAAQSKGELGRFMSVLGEMAESKSPEAYSDFLKTASKAEFQFSTLLDRKDEIDFAFTAGLSVADTVNFLKAAKDEDVDLEEFSRVAQGLSKTEKSLFLYGAGNVVDNVNSFTRQIGNLAGHRRANFLFGTANRGESQMTALVFMRGILSDSAYQNFITSAESMKASELNELIQAVSDTSPQNRAVFLQAVEDSGQPASDFLSAFNRLSYETKNHLMDVSDKLDGDTRAEYIQMALMPDENALRFIDQAALLDGESQTGDLAYFVETTAKAKAEGKLDTFLSFAEGLTPDQKQSFFRTASQDLFSVKELMDLGKRNLDFAASGRKVRNSQVAINFQNLFTEIASGGRQAFNDFSQTGGLCHRFHTASDVNGNEYLYEIVWRPPTQGGLGSFEIKSSPLYSSTEKSASGKTDIFV